MSGVAGVPLASAMLVNTARIAVDKAKREHEGYSRDVDALSRRLGVAKRSRVVCRARLVAARAMLRYEEAAAKTASSSSSPKRSARRKTSAVPKRAPPKRTPPKPKRAPRIQRCFVPWPATPSASESVSQSVPVADEAITTCSICLEDMGPSAIEATLPCSHKFHAQCIDPWVASNNTCPVCRAALRFEGL